MAGIMKLSEIAALIGIPVVELSTEAIEAAWKRGTISGKQASVLQADLICQTRPSGEPINESLWQ